MRGYVYFFSDIYDRIIYIGRTKNLKQRLLNHNHLPLNCYTSIEEIFYVEFETDFDAQIAEKIWIAKYKPTYNSVHSDKNSTIDLDIENFDKRFIFSLTKEIEDGVFGKKFIDFIFQKIEKEYFGSPFYLLDEEKMYFLYKNKNKSDVYMLFFKYGCKNVKENPKLYAEMYINYYLENSAKEIEKDFICKGYLDEDLLDTYALNLVYECSFFDGKHRLDDDEDDFVLPREHVSFKFYLAFFEYDIEDIYELFENIPDDFFNVTGELFLQTEEWAKNAILEEISKKYDLSKKVIIPILK